MKSRLPTGIPPSLSNESVFGQMTSPINKDDRRMRRDGTHGLQSVVDLVAPDVCGNLEQHDMCVAGDIA